MSDNPTMTQRLRRFLRGDIKGKFTQALLEALAANDEQNALNIIAARQNMRIATAEERYLEKLAAGLGITKPAQTGIDDDSFRNLAITLSTSQAVSNVFLEVLELFYGKEATRANVISTAAEPFNIPDQSTLLLQSDADERPLTVTFQAQDFASISAATALEIATVISRAAVTAGSTLRAEPFLDADSGLTYVHLFSGTKGPTSWIKILGGLAQNILRFPQIRDTTQVAGTQFTYSVNGSRIRYTWTSGTDPSLQNVSEDDYVVIKSGPFPSNQAGTFTIKKVSPDVVGQGYFEIENPLVTTTAAVNLGTADDMRWYYPKRFGLPELTRFATIYEVNPYELIVYLPATTRIVKRELIGGTHLHASVSSGGYEGSFLFNSKGGLSISKVSAVLDQTLSAGQPYTVVQAQGSTADFPDAQGFVVLDFGTSNQEGPIRYLARPSDGTLLLDASYTMKRTHVDPDITLLRRTTPYLPATDGSDLQAFITGTIRGRVEAERISNEAAMAGIFVNVIIVYPNAPGWNSVQDVYAEDQT